MSKFVRYLPDFDIRPIVLAGPGIGRGRWEPTDPSLSDDVPEDVAVYRPEDPPPAGFGDSRLHRILGTAGAFPRWWQHAVLHLGTTIAREHHPRVILVTAPPYHSIGSAIRLAERLGLPVVVDLRDPWALDEGRFYPSGLHRRKALGEMRRLLTAADAVVMNCPEAGATVRSLVTDQTKIDVLPNGFDAADFATLTRRPTRRLQVVHTGYLHSAAGLEHRRRQRRRLVLGAQIIPIDLLGRSHFYLLESLRLLAARNPGLTDRVEIILAGVLSDMDKRLVELAGLDMPVLMPGYVDHRQAIQCMIDATVLFLPLHGLPDGHRARIVPGKTYEYLASGTPILAALPNGDARDLIVETAAGIPVEPADVDAMAAALEKLLMEAVPRRPVNDLSPGYERRELTGRLAEILHNQI